MVEPRSHPAWVHIGTGGRAGTFASAGRPEALLWLRDGAYSTVRLLSPSEPHAGLDSSGGGLGYLLLPLEIKFFAGSSSGALLKATFICAGIVHVGSKLSLREQLLHTFGGGFELHTWSELPHGSGLGEQALSSCCPSIAFATSCLTSDPLPGLCPAGGVGGAGLGGAELFHAWCLPLHPAGTSSILAGAALAALQRAAGRVVGTEALIHAVLHLEQVLTTGMGLPQGRREVMGIFPRPFRGSLALQIAT